MKGIIPVAITYCSHFLLRVFFLEGGREGERERERERERI
jgi:hypothetical protein